jgi:hypothetical protein
MALLTAQRPNIDLHLGTVGLTILTIFYDLKKTGEGSCKLVNSTIS